MRRLLFISFWFILSSCNTENELFEDVSRMADFQKNYTVKMLQSGEESSFIEPLMEYAIFAVDSSEFDLLEESIKRNDKFNEGIYYLHGDTDDYLYQNDLDILNMSNCEITENKHDKTYHVYLLSDEKRFIVIKRNH